MPMDEKYPLALPEGTVLAGQYVIEKVLGQGGFGITYRANDHKTNQKVAIKEFFPDTLAYREIKTVTAYPGERYENYVYGKECFLQEAKTLAEFIGNVNIVRIHSYFEENGTAYFVMDYIEGKSFDEYIKDRGGKISVEEAKNILVPVMDALDVVHSKGIVHRDVTPDNIYITNDGTVKLLDFGAARYSLGDKSRSLDVILKHGFAPKEQYTRRGKQGPYTDIYSLAATFYFAITGKRPPDSVDRLDEDDLIPPGNLGIKITEYQENAILQALSVQPVERFQSMAEFKRILLNESPTANQMFYNAPEASAAPVTASVPPVVQQGANLIRQGSPAVEQGLSAAQQGNSSAPKATQVQEIPKVGMSKNKKLIIGLSAAGVAMASLIVLAVGIKFFNDRDVDVSSNNLISDNTTNRENFSSPPAGLDFGDLTMPSAETPEPISPAEETPEPATPEPVIYDASELTVVGTTAANIKNLGIYTADEYKFFSIDDDFHTLYTVPGTEIAYIHKNMDGEFTCLSYYDGVLYFVYDGKAYMRNITDSSAETLIPELEAYNGNIERLYITVGCYFVYADEKLYRISRKTGEEEEWIAISSPNNISFCDGWLYYIGENEEKQSEIYRAPADDFKSWDYSISIANGSYSHPVAAGNYIYVLWNNEFTTIIYRYDSALSLDNACSWNISGLVNMDEQNDGNYATQLNVAGSDLLFCVYSAVNDTFSLYSVIGNSGNGSDFDYKLLSSGYALYPCITGREEDFGFIYIDGKGHSVYKSQLSVQLGR